MLMRKTLACLLIPTLLTIANTSKANALSTGKVEENKVINYNDTNDDLTLMNMYLNYELECQRDNLMAKVHRDIKAKELITQKVNERINKIEELRKIEEQKRIEEENSYNIDFTISHYGLSESENGGFEGLNCNNKPLREGTVASNYYKIGTIIEFENKERVVVEDTGGYDFYAYNRLDYFVPTYDNEYLNRLGRYKIKGKVICP